MRVTAARPGDTVVVDDGIPCHARSSGARAGRPHDVDDLAHLPNSAPAYRRRSASAAGAVSVVKFTRTREYQIHALRGGKEGPRMSKDQTMVSASANGATPQTQTTTSPSMPVLPAATLAPAIDPVRLGDVMFRSGLFPDLRSAAQAVVKILAGRELGIGPFAALSDIHIIEGKATVGARILAGLVRASRHYDYKVVEWTNERVAIDFYRDGEKLEPTITFDQSDAERAGLTNPTRNGRPSNHTRYPRHMKFARAMSTGVGLHCPDLTAGVPVYTTGELDADPRPEGGDVAINEGEQLSPDRAAVASAGAAAKGAAQAERTLSVPELLSDAARCGYHSETVVALARFYYGADNLNRLRPKQRAALARRIAAAHRRGVGEQTLRELADKGAARGDREAAIHAADRWLRGARAA